MSRRVNTRVTPTPATVRWVFHKDLSSETEAHAELSRLGLDVRLSAADNAIEARAALAQTVDQFVAAHGRVAVSVALNDATDANERAMTLDEKTRAILAQLGLDPEYALCRDGDAARAVTKAKAATK